VSAFDELRFGPQRTLNLREHLPSAAMAVRRTEAWLREHQVRGSKEVLVITGRGNQSIGGVGVVRGAVEKLLFSLRRRGVIASHQEHNPGAFAVQLAPLRALVEAPARNRDRHTPSARRVEIHGLSHETVDLLRQLAERSLHTLGVSADDATVGDEMHRHLSAIAPALPSSGRSEEHLRVALRAAIRDYD
jgi:hypothetical protein